MPICRPIFIVGSPRSGTSILTWCLGQHPNLLPLEESNWMAPFALDATVAFRRGSERGERSQISSMGMSRDEFLASFGSSIGSLIVRHRLEFNSRARQAAETDPSLAHPAFKISRQEGEPKERWVNGTPEYSFGICGLRKLFPAAKFIHLVRNCDEVVPSMIHFTRVGGIKLAEDEEDAYSQWKHYVNACLSAEKAYGSKIILRVFHHQLIQEPKDTIQELLDFVGESFDARCIEPLKKRINSSRVTAEDFCNCGIEVSSTIAEARTLWHQICNSPATLGFKS